MRTTSPQDQDQPPAAATSGSDTPPAVTDWRPARKSDRQFTVTDAAAITSPQERDSVMQQEPQERERQSDSRPETAREAAIDFIRPYVLDGWTFQEISKKQPRTDRDEYTARIGGGKVTDHRGEPHAVTREQIAVTRIGYTPCWGLFDLLDIMNEIRDERRGYKQQSLAAIFAQQEREHIAQESAPRKRPAIFRSYNGGHCQNPACGAELGYIETDGGRDRQYCNDKCRVAAHRARQREAKRAQVLQYHGELLDYWQRNGIRGEVLLRLQEILLQHGKTAAKRATDAVLVALAAAEEAGSNEQSRLIEEVMLGGEAIGYEEVMLEDYRIPQGVAGWSEFVSYASLNRLCQMRGYLYDRAYQEEYKAKARQRLEQFSRQVEQHPERHRI